MKNVFLKETYQILNNLNSIIVRVEYTNISNAIIYILKEKRGFGFYDKYGKKIKYIGLMVSRLPYTIDDYHKIPPGYMLTIDYDVTTDYDFKKHESPFTLRVYSGYFDPLTDVFYEGPIIEVKFSLQKTC